MRLGYSSRLLVAPLFNNASQLSSSVAMSTQRVLSIQSHTVHGFVGNKAAAFPLQCLGFNVDAINTVSLSNHPDYAGGCKGKSLSPDDVLAIVDGLDANNLLKYDLIITGYTNSLAIASETVTAVKRVIASNPRAIFVLDPVLGDDGKFYVPAELKDHFKINLLPLAFAITPNHFEVEKTRLARAFYFTDNVLWNSTMTINKSPRTLSGLYASNSYEQMVTACIFES